MRKIILGIIMLVMVMQVVYAEESANDEIKLPPLEKTKYIDKKTGEGFYSLELGKHNRISPDAIKLDNGDLFIVGGMDSGYWKLIDIPVYINPFTGKFEWGPIRFEKYYSGLVDECSNYRVLYKLKDNRILEMSISGNDIYNSIYIFDVDKETVMELYPLNMSKYDIKIRQEEDLQYKLTFRNSKVIYADDNTVEILGGNPFYRTYVNVKDDKSIKAENLNVDKRLNYSIEGEKDNLYLSYANNAIQKFKEEDFVSDIMSVDDYKPLPDKNTIFYPNGYVEGSSVEIADKGIHLMLPDIKRGVWHKKRNQKRILYKGYSDKQSDEYYKRMTVHEDFEPVEFSKDNPAIVGSNRNAAIFDFKSGEFSYLKGPNLKQGMQILGVFDAEHILIFHGKRNEHAFRVPLYEMTIDYANKTYTLEKKPFTTPHANLHKNLTYDNDTLVFYSVLTGTSEGENNKMLINRLWVRAHDKMFVYRKMKK